MIGHRLFAPALALWFGALFGLSSLAVRTVLFEQLVVATRLDQIVPAAAPPLGHAARLLLALGFAVVGALVGWMVGRALATLPAGKIPGLDEDFVATPFDPARPDWYPPEQGLAEAVPPSAAKPAPEPEPYQVRARDAHPDAPARRPISAREELRDAALDRPLEPLTLAEEAPAAVEEAPAVVEVAPAPVALPVEAPAAPIAAPAPPPPAPPPPAPVPPMAEEDLPRLGPARDGMAAHAVSAASPPPPPPAFEAEPPVAGPPAADPPAAAPAAAPALTAAERIREAAPASLSHVELIERLAIAMRRREEAMARTSPAPTAAAVDAGLSGDAAPPIVAQPAATPAAAPFDAAAAMRDALAALKDSGAN